MPAASGDLGDPFADWPDRTPFVDADGSVAFVYSASESVRGATPWADGVWVPDAASVDRAAALALQAMPGWLLSTSDGRLAAALVASGAAQRRHAHSMSTDLSGQPPPVDVGGLRVEPLTPAQVDRHALRLGALNYRAYPPDHADAFDGDEAAAVSQVRAIARGELLGPMLPESRVAVLDRGIAGACLVVDRPGDPPHAGPWVIDLFRDPALAVHGIGAAMLGATMRACAEARLPGLSLVVSHDNTRARRLYERLGFVDVQESWTLVLPKD